MTNFFKLFLSCILMIFFIACTDDKNEDSNGGDIDNIILNIGETVERTISITNPYNEEAILDFRLYIDESEREKITLGFDEICLEKIENGDDYQFKMGANTTCIVDWRYTPTKFARQEIDFNYNIISTLFCDGMDRSKIKFYDKNYEIIPVVDGKNAPKIEDIEIKDFSYIYTGLDVLQELGENGETHKITDNNLPKSHNITIPAQSVGIVYNISSYNLDINSIDETVCNVNDNRLSTTQGKICKLSLSLQEEKGGVTFTPREDNDKYPTYKYELSLDNLVEYYPYSHKIEYHFNNIFDMNYNDDDVIGNVIGFENLTDNVTYNITGDNAMQFELKNVPYKSCLLKDKTISIPDGQTKCFLQIVYKYKTKEEVNHSAEIEFQYGEMNTAWQLNGTATDDFKTYCSSTSSEY